MKILDKVGGLSWISLLQKMSGVGLEDKEALRLKVGDRICFAPCAQLTAISKMKWAKIFKPKRDTGLPGFAVLWRSRPPIRPFFSAEIFCWKLRWGLFLV